MDAVHDEGTAQTMRGASLRLVVPPSPRYAKYVRDRMAAFIEAHDIPPVDAQDFLTALGEALANAIEHSQTDEKIEASCWITGAGGLIASVIDAGVGFPLHKRLNREPHFAHADAERGRGLDIMRRCSDAVIVRSSPGKGTAVVLTRYVRGRRLRAVQDSA